MVICAFFVINDHCYYVKNLVVNQKSISGSFLDPDPRLKLRIRILQIILDPDPTYVGAGQLASKEGVGEIDWWIFT